MPDEYDYLDELSDKLVASPQLLKAWRASSAIGSSFAWHLLNHSWQLPPEISRDYIPHNPRLRIWNDAGIWTDNEPYTVTVFRGFDEPTRCRHAKWHCKQSGAMKERFIQFFDDGGEVQFYQPNITVNDADIPFVELNQHLRAGSQREWRASLVIHPDGHTQSQHWRHHPERCEWPSNGHCSSTQFFSS